MKRISNIGSLLKKTYRRYNSDVLEVLQGKGFIDLRPSFVEILTYVCEHDGPSIKEIGQACGLKKQTMTSHLNELENRGYIERVTSLQDKREQLVKLTDYGQRFKVNLLEVISDMENSYMQQLGDVEMERVVLMLENLYQKMLKY